MKKNWNLINIELPFYLVCVLSEFKIYIYFKYISFENQVYEIWEI